MLAFSAALPAVYADPDHDAAVAKQHYEHGKQLTNDGHFAEAYTEFAAGYALAPRPQFLFNMGECARAVGDRVLAKDLYSRYLAASPQGELAMTARARLEEINTAPVLAPPPAVVPAQVTPTVTPPPAVIAPRPTPPPVAVVVTPRPAPVPTTVAVVHPVPVIPSPAVAAASVTLEPRPSVIVVEKHSEPVYKRTWFWATIGAAVIAGTVAVIIATHGGDSCSAPNCVVLR